MINVYFLLKLLENGEYFIDGFRLKIIKIYGYKMFFFFKGVIDGIVYNWCNYLWIVCRIIYY